MSAFYRVVIGAQCALVLCQSVLLLILHIRVKRLEAKKIEGQP